METKCVGANFKMLVTVWTISVTKILYLLTLALCTNIQKMSPRSSFCRQHSKIVTNCKSPTSQCHQHVCSQSFRKIPEKHLFHITVHIINNLVSKNKKKGFVTHVFDFHAEKDSISVLCSDLI